MRNVCIMICLHNCTHMCKHSEYIYLRNEIHVGVFAYVLEDMHTYMSTHVIAFALELNYWNTVRPGRDA